VSQGNPNCLTKWGTEQRRQPIDRPRKIIRFTFVGAVINLGAAAICTGLAFLFAALHYDRAYDASLIVMEAVMGLAALFVVTGAVATTIWLVRTVMTKD
jgi:hypothetical protein